MMIKPVLIVFIVLFYGAVSADPFNVLNDKYIEIEDELFDNPYSIPLKLESSTSETAIHGDAFGIVYHPFQTVSHSLKSLKNWCDILPMHLNIKACTYQYIRSKCKLSIYSGRKFYEKAEDVYQLDYNFSVDTLADNYFNASLKAKEGPLDTTDYDIWIEAIPLGNRSTFIHIGYGYHYGTWARLAMSTYLATLGRNKIGFSFEINDEDNNPVYIKGVRAIIERNVIRYYFAIQSHLDSMSTPANEQFISRISHWFDLTEQYARQLHEMNKNDYLNYKKLEHQDQTRLQNIITEKNNISKITSPNEPDCLGRI